MGQVTYENETIFKITHALNFYLSNYIISYFSTMSSYFIVILAIFFSIPPYVCLKHGMSLWFSALLPSACPWFSDLRSAWENRHETVRKFIDCSAMYSQGHNYGELNFAINTKLFFTAIFSLQSKTEVDGICILVNRSLLKVNMLYVPIKKSVNKIIIEIKTRVVTYMSIAIFRF